MRRANGMPPTTLRRHIAVLVDCGLIIRRDSPNGKRFARKGQGGAIEQAYGFDLSPILARAEEFRALAEAVAAERKAFRLVKERLTICRRDVVKMIDAGINESVPGDWRGFLRRYEAIIARLPRTAPRQVLEAMASDLEDLWVDVHQTLETFVKSQNPDANESHSGYHIQNSNPDHNPIGESENGSGNKSEAGRDAEHTDNVRSLPHRDVPLGMVLSACPEIANYTRGTQIRTWRDFAAAADRARPTIGVSPSAWQEAVEVMGSQNASIALAAILQRAEHIRSCGGYLRDLTEKARAQKFSVWPMITALLNARVGALEKAAAGKGAEDSPVAQGSAAGTAGSSLDISGALRDSMKKKGW
ncbi:plasmid replication protein RepC [Mesorhizobium sp. VK24D]|uniref:Plasmid replication protein RepC n=1 Tax=Mesorhizobium album TaxID=3072314 RepID=A0ABU4Y1U9_9HYPH|nr:plasmid replication protein RepC [Mesorhizobium sp. VK24D]MDX8480925.1 plasmid replication protein RepC [Mesorhizobium sp. VK24D]